MKAALLPVVDATGDKIDQGSLLRYIVSFRNHNEFHEQCVERIFADIRARCRPTPDAASHTLRVMLPPEAPIEPGPAGLLCHSHDDLLWKQESFGLRGALQRADDGWRLEPLAIIPGISPDVLSLGRFFIDSRRKAKAYLAKRNLPRPTIPWDDIIAVKKQALSQ